MNNIIKCMAAFLMVVGLAVSMTGCGEGQDGSNSSKTVITNSGSDTMVNLAQMWAEAYQKVRPEISVEVAGGGSGVGVRDLMQGIVDVANCSRAMKDSEKEQTHQNTGKYPIEWLVGYDGVAVYVNKDNPIETLSLKQLKAIYAEGGSVEKWSQLGVDIKSLGASDDVVRVSRQNSSGTYAYFREKVLDEADYKRGSLDMSGSKDVVELVGKTKGAIGYSGMGYVSEAVKFVKLSTSDDSPAYEPSLENVAAGHYPLARPLRMYTLGQPEGEIKAYIDWILSPAGQKIVEDSGYIPVKAGK